VSVTIPLSFTAATPFTCSISHTSGTYSIGSTVNYSISSSTGEALQVVSFDPGTGSTKTGTLSATYSSAGWKTASVVARSASSGQYCNGGVALQDSVYINAGSLTCSAIASKSSVMTNEYFYVQAQIPASAGAVNPRITNVSSIAGAGFNLYWPDHTVAPWIYFSNIGSFPIYLTVQDDLGRTATCSTTEVVACTN
jgi:hypothetical protein